MEELLQDLLSIREACSRYAAALSAEFAVRTLEPPLAAFNACFNQATLSYETMTFFHRDWQEAPLWTGAPLSERRHRERNARIIEQTKGLFVLSLSALEFNAKLACIRHPRVLAIESSRRHYLKGIMGKSHAVGLIDVLACRLWVGITTIRNTIVHNDAFGEEDMVLDFGNGLFFNIEANVPMGGSFRNFARLIGWAVDGYADWARAFMRVAQRLEADRPV